jgi:hypothetical protein
MSGIKGKSGGARTGAGRKPLPEKKCVIKIPVYESLVNAKGGHKKVVELMTAALITAPIDYAI